MIRIIMAFMFVLLLMFLGFCAGMFAGSFFIPDTSGLAGPPTALMYGLTGLVLGLIIAMALLRFFKLANLQGALLVVSIISLIIVVWMIKKIRQPRVQSNTELVHYQSIDDFKGLVFTTLHNASVPQTGINLPIGVGIAKPHLVAGKTLYFYNNIPSATTTAEWTPVDSITLVKGQNFVEIATAPPWFLPEVLKLDYDILYLRTLTLTNDRIEVVVNNQTGQTSWVERSAVDFIDWPVFLLNVSGIEVLDPASNPVRVKPLDYASVLSEPPAHFHLQPLAIQSDWMQVSTLGLADRMLPTGWIRWRNGNRLLVTYSILS